MNRTLKSIFAAAALWFLGAVPAFAQTAPGWTFGYVPTTAQWNAVFAGKQDYLGAPPLLTTGGTMVGPLVTTASIAGAAGFNVQPGTAPSSPNNGDIWVTSSSVFVQINGSTFNLLTPGTPCSVCAVTNAPNTFLATQTITPTAASNNSALLTTQSTPNGGSVAGPITLNGITVTDGTQTVTGSGLDSFGQINNQTNAFRLNYTVTGGSANHFGLNVAVNVTASNGGTVPQLSSCYVNVGTITGDCWSNIAVGNVGPSGNLNQSLIGYEAEMLVASTGVVRDRVGFSANSQGPTVGTGIDAAFIINTFNLGTTGYLTAAPWKTGLYLSSNFYGANTFPIASTGNVILSDTGTVGNFVSAHTLTVTGNILDFPNVTLLGSGRLNLANVVNAGAFTVNPNSGTANAAFTVDTSLGSGNGVYVFSTAAGNDAGVTTVSSNTNESIRINAKAAGQVKIGNVSTGGVSVGAAGGGVTIGSALTYAGVTFNNTVTGSGNLVGSSGPTLSSPLIASDFGGSAVGSTKLINGTSNGSPSSAFLNLQSNGQFTSIGNTSPKTFLDVNENLSSSPALAVSTSLARLQAADATAGGQEWVTYGTTTGNILQGNAGGGTSTSPTGTLTGTALLNFRGAGYNSGFQSGGLWIIRAAENWSAGHQGTAMDYYTTPLASTTITIAMTVQPSGGLSIGTSTDPGIGSLQLNAQIFMPNITTTSAAQNGTVCWTTGTGKFTVDTTVGCLTSIMEAKNITERLFPEQALEIVSRLSPFAFRYKKGWGDGGRYEQFGLGAEEVAQVDERIVGRDPEGNLQGVRYQELTAVLAGAIKELKADNDNMRVEIERLRRAK